MADEVLSSSFNKVGSKLSTREKIVPIGSMADLGNVVGEIQNQLSLLLQRLNDDVSPEFKALMEGYVNKANESEELKVNLDNAKFKYEELKIEISQLRDSNRTLVVELQGAREILKNLESQLSMLQALSTKTEEEHKNKIKELNLQLLDYENKINNLEEENIKVSQKHEELRQEVLDQSFKFRQAEQELTIERDNLKKQVDEFQLLLKEQNEQLDFKGKELEYKDALINQLVKQATTDKLKIDKEQLPGQDATKEIKKKKRFGIF